VSFGPSEADDCSQTGAIGNRPSGAADTVAQQAQGNPRWSMLRSVDSGCALRVRSIPRKWRCWTMALQMGLRRSSLWSRGWARALTLERRPVSHPRSSNRTCPIKASGFPTGFTAELTNEASVRAGETAGLPVPRTPRLWRSGWCHANAPDDAFAGNAVRFHRRDYEPLDTPLRRFHS